MIEKCPRTGKLSQEHHEAVTAMEFMRPTDPRQDLLEVYPCPPWASAATAEHWHVGHVDPAGRGGRGKRYRAPTPAPTLTHTLGDALPPHLRELAAGGSA